MYASDAVIRRIKSSFLIVPSFTSSHIRRSLFPMRKRRESNSSSAHLNGFVRLSMMMPTIENGSIGSQIASHKAFCILSAVFSFIKLAQGNHEIFSFVEELGLILFWLLLFNSTNFSKKMRRVRVRLPASETLFRGKSPSEEG